MRRDISGRFLLVAILLCTGVTAGQNIDVSKRPLRTEPSRAFDVLDYRIELDLDWQSKHLEGRTTVTLTPFSDGFNTCVLDAETFTVTGVSDPAGTPLA